MKAYEIKLSKVQGTEAISETISKAEDAERFARKFYGDDIGIYESTFMIVLNRANKIIGWTKVSQGGTCNCTWDVKIIAKIAVDSLASAVIFVHNHPSGTTQPSAEDKKVTEKAKNALALFDICTLDHIILTESGYYSMSDNGVL